MDIVSSHKAMLHIICTVTSFDYSVDLIQICHFEIFGDKFLVSCNRSRNSNPQNHHYEGWAAAKLSPCSGCLCSQIVSSNKKYSPPTGCHRCGDRRKIWLRIKLMSAKSLIWSVVLYACHSWTVKKENG